MTTSTATESGRETAPHPVVSRPRQSIPGWFVGFVEGVCNTSHRTAQPVADPLIESRIRAAQRTDADAYRGIIWGMTDRIARTRTGEWLGAAE